MVIPTGTKGPPHVARPGGPLVLVQLVLPTGTKGAPLVPGTKPGLKEETFSPDFVLPVPKPGLKAVENREYSPFLH